MSAAEARDRGLTLIELIITVALLTLVITVTGTILVSALKVQAGVNALGSASNGAQLVARSLQRGIGNASAFKAEAPTADGQLLRARVVSVTAAGTPTWRCVAWYWSATAKTVRTTSSTAGLVAAPTAASLATWSVLATHAQLPTGTMQPFTGAGTQLLLRLAVGGASATRPVLVATTVAAGPQSDSTTAPTTCF
jgi:prepilin-type N-terminal cleavage/methylation domain-containing protein